MKRLQFVSSWDAPFAPDPSSPSAFDVFSATIIEQRNGNRIEPIFRVTIRNPGVAGWMPSALRYADIWEQRGYDHVNNVAGDSAPVHLARGRLVPLPTGMAGQEIELTFRCLPPNSNDVLKSAANALRVGEDIVYDPDASVSARLDADYYDPLFYSADAVDDPDTALSARPEVWRWDRKTLTVGRTHLVNSDVVHDIAYGGVGGSENPPSLSVNNPPRPITKMRLTATWTQTAKGKQSAGIVDSVTTFTFDDFIAKFPQAGTAIGAKTGWTIADAYIESVTETPINYLEINSSAYGNAAGGRVAVRAKWINYTIKAGYDYQQNRQEVVTISLPSGLQEIPEEDDSVEIAEQITLSQLNVDNSTPEWTYEDPTTLVVKHYAVGDQVLANGLAWTCVLAHNATLNFNVRNSDGATLWTQREKRSPMRDARNAAFLDSDRGLRALRHSILRLARKNLERSQCAETTFEVPYLLAREITCEHSMRIAHRKLPGGELVGKVVGVELDIAKDGSRSAKITLASVPGTGASLGSPSTGQSQTGDIIYSAIFPSTVIPVNAFALDAQTPRIYNKRNIWSDQLLDASGAADPIAAIGQHPTTLAISFTPLREEDLITRHISVTCSPLALPKQINLRPDLGG